MTCKVDEEFMSHGIKWFGPAMGFNPLTTLGQMLLGGAPDSG
jgi:hypothetical protein